MNIKKIKAYLGFEVLMIVSVVGLNIAFFFDHAAEAIIFKSAAGLFFVAAGLCGYLQNKDNRAFFRPVFIAILCCMAGDVFLALDSDGLLFLLGVVSFGAAHVLFSVAFCKKSPVKKTDIVAAAVLLLGFTLSLFFVDLEFRGLLPVVILYAAIIAFMAIKALSLWPYRKEEPACIKLLTVGGVLFLISDLVLLFWLFGTDPQKPVQSVNWVLYYSSQLCTTAALNEYVSVTSNQKA